MQREDHWFGFCLEKDRPNKRGVAVGNVRIEVLSG